MVGYGWVWDDQCVWVDIGISKIMECVRFMMMFVVMFCNLEEHLTGVLPFGDFSVDLETVFFFVFVYDVGCGTVE